MLCTRSYLSIVTQRNQKGGSKRYNWQIYCIKICVVWESHLILQRKLKRATQIDVHQIKPFQIPEFWVGLVSQFLLLPTRRTSPSWSPHIQTNSNHEIPHILVMFLIKFHNFLQWNCPILIVSRYLNSINLPIGQTSHTWVLFLSPRKQDNTAQLQYCKSLSALLIIIC